VQRFVILHNDLSMQVLAIHPCFTSQQINLSVLGKEMSGESLYIVVFIHPINKSQAKEIMKLAMKLKILNLKKEVTHDQCTDLI
jgi:hypothetical protein